jgi:hypothetical protein
MFFSTFQIWDVGIKIQASGIIVEGWCGTFIPHFHAHMLRSHVQRPELSLDIRIGIKDARRAK